MDKNEQARQKHIADLLALHQYHIDNLIQAEGLVIASGEKLRALGIETYVDKDNIVHAKEEKK